jgi:hypothetical protein
MQFDVPTMVEALGSLVAVIGGLYTTYRHISLSLKIKKENEKQAILDEAKTELDKVSIELNEKIKDLEIELALAKENITKDFVHMKEIYSAEINELGSKIEALRQDLQSQHSQMIELLTRLVGKS